MKKSKLLFLFITLITFSFPLYSLTWKEFFDALQTEDLHFNFPKNAKNKQVTCWKKVYWEEYIEGNAMNKGYVNSFNKEIKITCPY